MEFSLTDSAAYGPSQSVSVASLARSSARRTHISAQARITGASVMHEVALCGSPKLPPRMWPIRWLSP